MKEHTIVAGLNSAGPIPQFLLFPFGYALVLAMDVRESF